MDHNTLQANKGFSRVASSKEPACQCERLRDVGSIPRLGRFPGGEHGNPLQYSCLENPMDRGAWQAAVHGVARVGHDLATKPPPSRFTQWSVSVSRVWLFVTLWTVAARLLCPWDSPGKNTGVGCHALLQGIFPTQGSNHYFLCLLHWQAGSLPLAPPGKPLISPYANTKYVILTSSWMMVMVMIMIYSNSISVNNS